MVHKLSCLFVFLSGDAVLRDKFMSCLEVIKDPPKFSLNRCQETRLVFTTWHKLYFIAF